MRIPLLLLVLLGAFTRPAQMPSLYERAFTDGTMRVDYFHTGGPLSGETFALDNVLHDGPWGGSRRQLVDETNLGAYLFEVKDKASGSVLYSRGFSPLYGEWETTAEAKSTHRTFHESLRFPWPRQPVLVTISKRHKDNRFAAFWTTEIDPSSRFVNREPRRAHAGTLWTVFENGPSTRKVDLLVISEGYTAAEMPKFHRDVRRLLDALFAEEPFKSRKGDFNVRALDLPSAQSGINRPNAGVFKRTPLSAEFNIFDSERYVLTRDNRALREAASAAPYEFVEILANERTYGGGGLFNDHATATVDSAYSPYVFVHEFGHHFAALADEYYTSDVAYETGVTDRPEPWEPNVTRLRHLSAGARSAKVEGSGAAGSGATTDLKWADLVTPGTPLPTPWDKAEFEKHSAAIQARRREIRKRNAPEEEMDALFREQQAWETPFLAGMKYGKAVGAFEGASYEPKGLYRPQADCIMFSRNPVGFCRVCRRAITRIIDLYSS